MLSNIKSIKKYYMFFLNLYQNKKGSLNFYPNYPIKLFAQLVCLRFFPVKILPLGPIDYSLRKYANLHFFPLLWKTKN